MARQDKVGTTATRVHTDSLGVTRVTYHDTDVVSFNWEFIVLRTGGWYTATTKSRMNQASRQFGLRFSVYQHKYKWFVNRFDKNGNVIGSQVFHENMQLRRGMGL